MEKIKKIQNYIKNLETVKIAIILILLITFVRGVIYATVFPLWQAPDEPVQFQYVDYYARKHLPFESNAKYKKSDSLIKERADKEILDSWYKLKSWEFIDWYKTDEWFVDGKRVKKLSDKMGMIPAALPPGYALVSLVFYAPTYFSDVWIRAYAVRLLSIILGVLVVYLGYRTAKELFPDDIFMVLGIPLFITFVPMFTHISAAINPDNLANFSAALFIFYSVKVLKKLSWSNILMLVLSIFIGMYAKRTTFFTLIMLLLIPIFILILSKSDKLKVSYNRYGAIFIYFTLAFLAAVYLVPMVMIKLGFYVDLASIKNIIINYFKTKPINELISAIKLFSENFWASFGWGLRISDVSYFILRNAFLILLTISFLVLGKEIFYKRRFFTQYQLVSISYLLVMLVIAFSIVVIKQVIINSENIPARYLFPVIIPIAFFATLGLFQLFKNKKSILLLMFLLLFLFDVSTLLIHIMPFYYKTPPNFNLTFLSPLANLFNKPFMLNSVYFYIFIFSTYLFLVGYLTYYLFSSKEFKTSGFGQPVQIATIVGVQT